ncbi:hypothetical protein PUN28_006485 [Cardiocondyla obscurior]|uniref:Uncharacterized protein n=1 Tax=Cardiocondyla obscurior TaxID=286306 RepID=A0AAW2GBQ9_9HYME
MTVINDVALQYDRVINQTIDGRTKPQLARDGKGRFLTDHRVHLSFTIEENRRVSRVLFAWHTARSLPTYASIDAIIFHEVEDGTRPGSDFSSITEINSRLYCIR